MKFKYLPFSGEINLSGSKSIIQRIMLISSIHRCRIELSPASVCEDVLEMAEALRTLNIMVLTTPDRIIINSECMVPLEEQTAPVCFKASATAFRFWLARTIISQKRTIIMISEQLFNRPWKIYLDTLNSFGCDVNIIEAADTEFPYHFEITRASKQVTEIQADSSLSSQFISGLMLVAPFLKSGLNIQFKSKPVSYSYLNLTYLIMQTYGVECELNESGAIITDSGYRLRKQYCIEPDMSSAAFFLSLGAFSEKGISLDTKGINRWQPDWKILDILKGMGANVTDAGYSVIVKAGLLVGGVEIDMQNNPDLVPVVAILALFAESEIVLRHINRLQIKESDRLKGITNAFDMIGAEYDREDDYLKVSPLQNEPGELTLNTQSDHRLVMAFTLLQLHFPQISLSEGNSVVKSCPEFYPELASLKKLNS